MEIVQSIFQGIFGDEAKEFKEWFEVAFAQPFQVFSSRDEEVVPHHHYLLISEKHGLKIIYPSSFSHCRKQEDDYGETTNCSIMDEKLWTLGSNIVVK